MDRAETKRWVLSCGLHKRTKCEALKVVNKCIKYKVQALHYGCLVHSVLFVPVESHHKGALSDYSKYLKRGLNHIIVFQRFADCSCVLNTLNGLINTDTGREMTPGYIKDTFFLSHLVFY